MNENKKELLKEKVLLQEDLDKMDFERHELIKVYAVDIIFNKKNFKQSIINQCYFRRCIFRDCDFTGTYISNTNFQGANFVGCIFKYTTFKTTDIGIIPLSRNLPSEENLKMQLARNLRVNYASIGNYDGVNFAIKTEIAATLTHLRKASFSSESYYRNKKEFSGFGRFTHILKFIGYSSLEQFWGNGEKPIRMLYSIPILLVLLSYLFSLYSSRPILISIKETICVFFIGKASSIIGLAPTIITIIFRYITIGLFVSSLVRRLSRR